MEKSCRSPWKYLAYRREIGSPYPKPACKGVRREREETLALGFLELQGPDVLSEEGQAGVVHGDSQNWGGEGT